MKNTLQAGFSRVNITPMLGIGLAGYFVSRKADGVLDELEINALAIACGEECGAIGVGCFASYGVEFGIIVEFEFHVGAFDRVVIFVGDYDFGT